MLRVAEILAPGSWPSPADDRLVLDADQRHRRRMAFVGEGGLALLLDLPSAVLLRHGAGLRLEDGRIVEVVARPEPLLEVRGDSPDHLLRLAWHIGNRHLTAQMTPGAVRIRRDHVIAEMLAGLGATVTEIEASFDPEGGAYGGVHEPHDHGEGDHLRPHHDHDHHHG